MDEPARQVIALIGLGTIGISFAALHLKHSDALLRVYDPRPDLKQHVASMLPVYLESTDPSLSVDSLISGGRFVLCSTLAEACTGASIVQEQGPENLQVKASTWSEVLRHVSPTAHLWSSTSGVPASQQVQELKDKTRLLVVHPFNPPHVMPLVEIVPSPETDPGEVQFAKRYFEALKSGHRPVVVRKEASGFVANRLAFILFREACSLVADDIVSVQDLDTIVEASLGPRWAVAGPFKSYSYGGGTGGLPAFLRNLSGTMEEVWQSAGTVSFERTEFDPTNIKSDGATVIDDNDTPHDQSGIWTHKVIQQTLEGYGFPDSRILASRDAALRRVLQAAEPHNA
ncbi:uncharacterized protein Z518_03535 [Rhinocladiella mackenziei CBS 650.93]|uniref:3-hydroxyacyl-CoA dehydrogenase n=1 Tax=Rhinocladiella mackenziei CBS 650.93 TaxID=1442369 RepID=A0A0D2HE82_9EURO|nr:uncharacterized protein Z518_03535 [Rhinocladiella mackenziei CBS 650.93]KIX08878.1 hypothetical protein Z518_03535 [Rhinocladiella mackenziei CBS 650.93]